MGVLDRFEKGVENAMQSAFAKTFKSGVKPVELAAAVKRECDARAAAVDRNRTVAPNEYVISLSPADHETVTSWGDEALAHELQDALEDHARPCRPRYQPRSAQPLPAPRDRRPALQPHGSRHHHRARRGGGHRGGR